MQGNKIHNLLNYFVAAVWLVNGLFCKVLNLVPRHQLIVADILGNSHSRALTFIIGLSETGMAIWVLTGINSRLNAIIQIAVVLTMNVIEFILAPELLLWGRLNLFFAILFILLVYYNQFCVYKKLT